MKKKLLFIIIYIIIATVIGVFIYNYNRHEKSEKFDNLISIDYTKMKDMFLKSETFAVLVIDKDCKECKNIQKTLGKISNEYDIKIYILDLSKLSDEDKNSFTSTYVVNYTPTTIFYEDGEEISTLNRITGDTSKEALISRLEKTNIIKEKK